jgi:uncharacterized membrane protein YfbV (UPF0208 family)
MAMFSRLPLIRNLSKAIAGLSPRAALLVFFVPMLLLLPFKIGGLWLLAYGHPALGISTFLLAKVVGTALFAWLFALTKAALLQIAWFAAAYGKVQQISQTAHAWIHRQPVYQQIRQMLQRLRAVLASIFQRH